MRQFLPRSGKHTATVLLALVLGTTALAGPASGAAPLPADDATQQLGGDTSRTEARRKPRPDFKIASLNLHNTMRRDGIRHDVRKIIRAGATVIGMQERRGTKRMVRSSMPDHWRVAMPTTADGTDDNPIAWNQRVWKLRNTWPRLLAKKTWYRDGYGKMAIEQYAVVATLRHRRSGHVVRVSSLHMPSQIQTSNGGPNWSQRDRVETFWRMSRNLRNLANNTPDRQQFVVTCDCNVSWGRDHTKELLKGKVSGPLSLMSNYSEGGKRRGWQIDYVLAERRQPYVIENWSVHHDLRTDHPGVVARFGHR